MTETKTIRERLAIIETKLTYLNQWLKGVIIAVVASMGITIAA